MLTYKFDWAIVTSGKYFDWIVSGLQVTMELLVVSIAPSFLITGLMTLYDKKVLQPLKGR